MDGESCDPSLSPKTPFSLKLTAVNDLGNFTLHRYVSNMSTTTGQDISTYFANFSFNVSKIS